ncbi:DNA-3-methyladenine glycosylase family protein [Rummeliibacillus sp. JY-2-4R]
MTESIILQLPKFFDSAANLGYLTRAKNECMYEVENGMITKAIVIGKSRYLVQINIVDNKKMLIQFLTNSNGEQQEAVAQYIREWFDLDTDLTSFYVMAKNDPLLKYSVQKFRGLRIMGIPDLFETLCWSIIGQQINLAFAYSLKRQFVESFGDFIEWNGKKYWTFPTYEQIAKLTPADLADIKMTVKKSEYIIGVAKLMEKGELSKEKLLKLEFEEAEKALIKIRGIGPWTANYTLMRCLRFKEAFPIDDVGLKNAIKTLSNMDRKPTKSEILNIAKSWKDWEAYATFYLWRVLY